MEKRNIYKTDDILIIGSFLMLIPAVYMAWPLLSRIGQISDLSDFIATARELLTLERIVMIFTSLDAAVTAQIVGRILRHRENQSRDILDTVMYMGKTTVGQVAGNLSLTEQRVRSLVQGLTRVRGLNIQLDGDVITRELSMGAPPSYAGHPSPVEQMSPGESHPKTEKPAGPSGETATLSSDLRDFLKNDKSDIYSKIEMLKRINETGGHISPEELKAQMEASPEKAKKLKGRMILLFFLFVTPLWPVALAATIYIVVKQYKSLKDKGLIQPMTGGEE